MVYSLSWAPGDLNCIVASTSKHGMFIWDVGKGRIIQRFQDVSDTCQSLSFTTAHGSVGFIFSLFCRQIKQPYSVSPGIRRILSELCLPVLMDTGKSTLERMLVDTVTW